MEQQEQNKTFFFNNIFPIIKQHHDAFDWPDVKETEVEPVYMKALSNMTYRVKCKVPGTQPILTKYFGKGFLDRLLDRKVDNEVSSTLGDLDIGPKVYFYSDECRIEQFLFSAEFTSEDMLDDSKRKLLTYYISNFHRARIESIPKGSLLSRCKSGSFPLMELAKEAAEKKQELFDEKEKQVVQEVLQLATPEEVEFLTKITADFEEDLVISHNDFLNGNILTLPTGELKLIDFEYASYNIKMYDIANFINESLFNYAIEKFPYFEYNGQLRDDDDTVRKMVKYYALFSKQDLQVSFDEATELIENEKAADAELLTLYGSAEEVKKAIDDLMRQLHAGYLLSHAVWVLWAVTMCKNNNIQFGYLEFAKQRFDDYLLLKSKYYADK